MELSKITVSGKRWSKNEMAELCLSWVSGGVLSSSPFGYWNTARGRVVGIYGI
jgi:hypothetical protein